MTSRLRCVREEYNGANGVCMQGVLVQMPRVKYRLTLPREEN